MAATGKKYNPSVTFAGGINSLYNESLIDSKDVFYKSLDADNSGKEQLQSVYDKLESLDETKLNARGWGQHDEYQGRALIIDENGGIQPGYAHAEVDNTLLKEGVSADAKAVGEKLAEKITIPEGIGSNKYLLTNANGNITWGDGPNINYETLASKITSGDVIIDPTLSTSQQAADAKAAGDRVIIATNWDSNTTYGKGARVAYNNNYYVCQEDSVTGAWDSTKWELVENNLLAINASNIEEALIPTINEIASMFVDSQSYSKGDYVYYTNNEGTKLYYFIEDHIANSGWDSEKVVEAQIGTEVSNLKSAIENIDETNDVYTSRIADNVYAEKITIPTFSTGSVVTSGGISQTNGSNNGSSFNSVRCKTTFIPIDCPLHIKIGLPEYKVYCHVYSSESPNAGTHTGLASSGEYVSAEKDIYVDYQDGDTCIRLAFYRADGQALTTDMSDSTSDFYKITNALEIYKTALNGLESRVSDIEQAQNEIDAELGRLDTAITNSISNALQLGIGSTTVTELKGTENEHLSLDTVTDIGTYRISAVPSTRYIDNYPVDRSGKIIICKTSQSNYFYQIYLAATNQIFVRAYTNSGYTDWKEIAGMDTVLKCLQLGVDLNTLSGTSEEPLSLNTVTSAGTYKIIGTMTTAHITNGPSAGPGKLIVCKTYDNTRIYQIYLSTGNGNKVHIRSTNDGTTFTDWQEVAYKNYVDDKYDALDARIDAIGPVSSGSGGGDSLAIRELLPDYYTKSHIITTSNKFSALSNYKAGDRVYYPATETGMQYVFTADHPKGAWTGTDVEQVTFDPSKTYQAGDEVVYGDTETQGFPMLPYKFISAHTGAWDPVDVVMTGSFDNIAAIEKWIKAVPNGNSFFFITDTHWESNAKNSPKLLSYAKGRLGIDTCFFGGDFIDAEANKYDANQLMHDFADSMFAVFGKNFYTAIGNHDNNLANYLTLNPTPAMLQDKFLPFKQIYDCLFMPYADKANTFWDGDYWTYASTFNGSSIVDTTWTKQSGTNGDKIKQIANNSSLNEELEAYGRMTYYIDDENLKIRFISIMCLFKPDYGAWFDVFGSHSVIMYIGWLYHVILNTPTGYSVIILTHQGPDSLTEKAYGSLDTALLAHMLMGVKLKAKKLANYSNSKITANMARFMSGTDNYDTSVMAPFYCDYQSASDVGPAFAVVGHSHVDDILILDQDTSQWRNVNATLYDGTSLIDQTVRGTYNGCPIPFIHVTTDACDRYRDSYNGGHATEDQLTVMEKDSIIEQAFDVVTVSSNRIDFTRFGAGNNRSINIKY